MFKKESFTDSMRNTLNEFLSAKAKLEAEISAAKTEIETLTQQISAFDGTDVETFNKLKDAKAYNEDRLELLNRQLTKLRTRDAGKIASERAQFLAEHTRILNAFHDDMVPIIDQMQTIYENTEGELNALINLHNLWRESYNLTQGEYIDSTQFISDLTGTKPRVRQFLCNVNRISIT